MMIKGLLLYIVAFSLLVVSYAFDYLSILGLLAMLVLLVGVILLWKSDGRKLNEFGLRSDKYLIKRLVLGFIIGLTIPLFFLVLEVGTGWLVLEQVDSSVSLLVTGTVKIILFVIIEEVVFRGYYIQKFLVPEKQWVAVFLSSIFWACLHIPNMVHSGISIIPTLIGTGSFVVIGIALGLAFLHTGKSLWLPLGIHLGYNNAFSMIGTFFSGSYSAPSLLVGTPPWTPESGIIGILLAIMMLIVVLLLRTVYENSM
jgi:membrane protease YdiL (CAAX protease family)